MKGSTAVSKAQPAAQPTEKLYMENTLLRVAGALFCHDAKRARGSAERIELNRGLRDWNLIIDPHPNFGRPGPLAHKVFVAIIKKHSDYGRPVQGEVSFTRREIMRLVGRSQWGGRDSEQFAQALQQIHRTFVTAFFKDRSDRFIEESFNVFPRILLARREKETDPIEECTIALADPIVASLRDDHFTCLNHTFMRELGTIGQALYMRLFFHFANHYDGHHDKRLKFDKRYDDICREWLGGLTVLKHRSKILQEQLGVHLDQLRAGGFLVSYGLEPARTREGFVITFRPGARFFADYDRFYRNRHQGELQWRFTSEQRDIAAPLKVAYRFIEKRTGETLAGIPYVTSKEVATAKRLLQEIPFEEMDAFIDYGLAEARRTNFDIQTLGGLAQYAIGFLHTKRRRVAQSAAAAAKEQSEQEAAVRAAYTQFRRDQAVALFPKLPKSEQRAIENLAQAQCKGVFAKSALMIEYSRAQITAERHAEKIPSFEKWNASRRAE